MQKVPFAFFTIFTLMMIFIPDLAHASSSTGMPWENPLLKVVNSITGPLAFGISVVAVCCATWPLAFGGELTTFAKTALYIALAISFSVFAVNILSSLFGISSTLVS